MSFKPNTECFKVNNKFYTFKLNCFWQLLYYHDYTTAMCWNSFDEAKNSLKKDKYSILYSLNEKYKINGEYEFLLEYPELTGYNHWCQTSSPLEEKETDSDGKQNATGYRVIQNSWTGEYFGGLVLSSNAQCLIDGSTYHSNTWYSIGRTEEYYGGVPGPCKTVQKTQLWIRVSNPNLCSARMKRACQTSPVSLFFIILLHTRA